MSRRNGSLFTMRLHNHFPLNDDDATTTTGQRRLHYSDASLAMPMDDNTAIVCPAAATKACRIIDKNENIANLNLSSDGGEKLPVLYLFNAVTLSPL